VVRALDLRLKGRGFTSQPLHCRVQLSTLDKLFTHIVQRLRSYDVMALYKSV